MNVILNVILNYYFLHRWFADDGTYELTEYGKRMAKLPLEPRLARLVLRGLEERIPFEAAMMSALAAGYPVFYRFVNPPLSSPEKLILKMLFRFFPEIQNWTECKLFTHFTFQVRNRGREESQRHEETEILPTGRRLHHRSQRFQTVEQSAQ